MSPLSSAPKFRLAICGAGLAGLVLASTIERFSERDLDIQIDLYEAQGAIATDGAGITVSLRTMEVFNALGLHEEVSRVSTSTRHGDSGLKYRKSDIPDGGFQWHQRRARLSTMHRKDLVNILKQHIPSSCTVHFDKRLTKYEKVSAGSIILHFADESTESTDILIGADGIRSSVRKTLFETINQDVIDPSKMRHYIDPSWTGTCIYRTVFPVEKLSEIDPNNIVLKEFTLFCGKGKDIVAYPVSQGTQINISAAVTNEQKAGTPFEGRWVSNVNREEVEEAYRNFEPAARNIVKCMEHPSRWALHITNELPLSTCDRVALIGDACHAMAPYLGAGAGQAMEDAFVLGRLLTHPLTTLDNVSAALKAYQDVRLPDAQLAVRNSTLAGNLVHFNEPGYYDGTNHGNEPEELQILAHKMTAVCEIQDQGDSMVGWQQAERILQKSIVTHAISYSSSFCRCFMIVRHWCKVYQLKVLETHWLLVVEYRL